VSPAKKKAMIRRDHPDLSISQQCKLVKLSRSVFDYMPVGVSGATLELMKAIDRAFTKYPFFGSPQIAAYLRRDGIVVGRHRVRRLMAKMGLEAIYKRPRTSHPHPQHKVYPYLLRGMTICRLNKTSWQYRPRKTPWNRGQGSGTTPQSHSGRYPRLCFCAASVC
jgi:putative transposase